MTSLRKVSKQTYVNLYFQVHQPRRVRNISFFDIGKGLSCFDDASNREIITRIARDCYLPANEMFLDLIQRLERVRLTFSISGVALEQFMRYTPEVIDSFRRLAATGSVEFLAETYYHSLASIADPGEFRQQVDKHRSLVHTLFGVYPRVFRNTELIYSDEVGRQIADMGFAGVYADGIPAVRQGKHHDRLYTHVDRPELRVFLRNYTLSDDIAFRFSNRQWKEFPLTAEKYTRWLSRESPASLINLGLDYETLGEHQKSTSGIFSFVRSLVERIDSSAGMKLLTPSEAIALLQPAGAVSSPRIISWADAERDLSAWLGNDMQRDAFDTMRTLGAKIAVAGDATLLSAWNYLQTSDHFYYMSTKTGDDGRVHQHFSPYGSPYEAFMNYMNVLSDIALALKRKQSVRRGDRRRKTVAERSLRVA